MPTITFTNPTSIQRMRGHNWVRFNIVPPEGEVFSSGYYNKSSLAKSVNVPLGITKIAQELALMDVVEKYYVNFAEDKNFIAVKFKDALYVNDNLLIVIRDFIGEMLG